MDSSEVARQSQRLIERGFIMLEGLGATDVEAARESVLANAHLLKNTRPNPSAGHLAGFHRYPEVEPLHRLVSSNRAVLDILQVATGSPLLRSIGLSDITVNRSQEWHVDLLRGRYQRHLTPDICWGPDGGGVYKVLLYLQPGLSLRVVPAAHKRPVALDDDRKSAPRDPADPVAVEVKAGGIVVMDIRLPHRGSSEAELNNEAFALNPKILLSTVLGADEKPLTRAMERGNFERLQDWDAAHRDCDSPKISTRNALVEATVPY